MALAVRDLSSVVSTTFLVIFGHAVYNYVGFDHFLCEIFLLPETPLPEM